tara:strand:+ start:437 stop:898 length:462 start_codon:yes stop_codon:yes gene_type:complete
MESLPIEIINKILFPKHYKCNEDLTLNEKLYLSRNLENNITIGKQITHLVNEFEYQRNRSDFNMWRRTKHPSYIFILYQSLSKKNKEHTLDLTRKNYFRYLLNNIYPGTNYLYHLNINLMNTFANYTNNYTNNNVEIISGNHFEIISNNNNIV